MNLTRIQTWLKEEDFYVGAIDGDYGPQTKEAILALLQSRLRLSSAVKSWPRERLIVAAEQGIYFDEGIHEVGTIDGFVGPATLYAREIWEARQKGPKAEAEARNWRDNVEASQVPKPAPPAAKVWPFQKDVLKFFGPVGQNQTTLQLPYPMKIAWNTKQIVRSTSCHEKVHDTFLKLWTETANVYAAAEIERMGLNLFGGCLNVRQMRGSKAWSMHSWGIAWDFDPARNPLKATKATAYAARPEFDKFWKIVDSLGLVSLGRARNYDFMHIQAARI
jgi:peptidoglycan hydrolase-like protein with peptidoglycan-binding domain